MSMAEKIWLAVWAGFAGGFVAGMLVSALSRMNHGEK